MINFLNCLPGEHLMALPGRYFKLGINGGFKEVVKQLNLSSPTLRSNRLFHQTEWTLLALQEETNAIGTQTQHTLQPYVFPFLNERERQNVALRQTIIILGIDSLTTNYWRWCSECIREDESKYGIPFFHRNHQIPGVFHCDKHGAGLRGSCGNCGFSVSKFGPIYLPPEESLCPKCGETITPYSGYFSEDMRVIEQQSLNITQGINTNSLAETQKFLLQKVGIDEQDLETRAGKFALKAWHHKQAEKIDLNAQKAFFSNVNPSKYGNISPLIRNHRLFRDTPRPLHPLVHISCLHYFGYSFSQLNSENYSRSEDTLCTS